jgi:hypothetical protein
MQSARRYTDLATLAFPFRIAYKWIPVVLDLDHMLNTAVHYELTAKLSIHNIF